MNDTPARICAASNGACRECRRFIDRERIYIRFHGRSRWYRHDYGRAELVMWANPIKNSNAREVRIYFNNDREGFAISNAQSLRELCG